MKKSQKLRIIRYINDTSITFFMKYKDIGNTLDNNTSSAVEAAVNEIIKSPCNGISMTHKGISIQVDII